MDTRDSLRIQLYRDYEDVRHRHDRFLKYVSLSEHEEGAEIDWMRLVAEDHQASLAIVDRVNTSRQPMKQTDGLVHEVEVHTELERAATGTPGTKGRQTSTVTFPAESEIDMR